MMNTKAPSMQSDKAPPPFGHRWLFSFSLVLFLIAVSYQNYLLFHTLAELFAIGVAVLAAVVVWQTYPFSRNHYLMYLGCGYVWISALDLMHALLYKGMHILAVFDANPATQLWIAARYCEALLLLSALAFLDRPFKRAAGIALFGLLTVALYALIMTGNFPDAFVEGQGLTRFKVFSEYLIMGILGAALVLLWRWRDRMDRRIHGLVSASILLTICAELAFTFYVSVYGLSNMVGHLFKLFSYWLIFEAIVHTTLKEPFRVLNQNLVREMEERKQAQESLLASQASHKEAQQLAAIGHWTLDLVENELYWSDEIYRIFGIDPGKFGASYEAFLNVIHPDDRERVNRAYTDSVKNRTAYDIVHRTQMKDGAVKYVNEKCRTYYDDAGRPLRSIGTVQDITERTKAEQALVQSEARFKGVFESGMIGHLFWDARGDISDANETFLQMVGYTKEEVLSGTVHWRDMTPPEYREQDDRALQEVIDKGVITPIEKEYLRKDGTRIPVLLGAATLPGPDVSGVAYVIDITDKKRSEDAHRLAEENFLLLLNSTAEAIYGIDMQGRCSFVNPACLRMLGYDDGTELIGRDMHELIHHSREDGSRYPLEECRIYRAFKSGEGSHVDDEVLWRRDGSSFPVEYWSYPMYQDGAVVGSVVTFVDISDRKQAELEREQLLHDMGERVKELRCMFGITEAIRRHTSLEEIFHETVRLIPQGWHHSEYTRARIIFDDREFAEDPFQPSEWKLALDLIIGNQYRGAVEVYLTKEFPELDEGPFLQQERNLLNGIVKTLSEAIERKSAEAELQHLVAHDALTGLYNRKILEQKVTGEILRAARYERPLSVFLLDLDHFKRINDTHGHPAGDRVLRDFAQILQESVRGTDYAARYGGEEFVVVLPETEPAKAELLAERLRGAIAEHPISLEDGKPLNVTVSIGIASFPEHARSWKELLQAADTAMYEAKVKGRNCVQAAHSAD